MITKTINVPYFSYVSKKPTIISPKSDSDWYNNRNITFRWKYNGGVGDFQHKYRIQIFDIPYSYLTNADFLSEWNEDGSTDNSAYLLAEADNIGNPLTFSVYDTGDVSTTDESVTIDLSAFLSGNGAYIWRIQTSGFIATDWSDWASDQRDCR